MKKTNILVNKIAVNIEVKIPTDKVIAKPCTGPVPTMYKISATINVVKLASTIVMSARSYPDEIASKGFIFRFNSSLILEKINTFASTAIPMVNTIPAIPGKVKVADKIDIIEAIKIKFNTTAKLARNPNTL